MLLLLSPNPSYPSFMSLQQKVSLFKHDLKCALMKRKEPNHTNLDVKNILLCKVCIPLVSNTHSLAEVWLFCAAVRYVCMERADTSDIRGANVGTEILIMLFYETTQ